MSRIVSGGRSSSFNSTTTSSSSSLSTSSSSSSVPFSWETLPGVPKQISNLPTTSPSSKTTDLPSLPLPPQLRCNSGGFLSVPRKKWSSSYVDNEESFVVWDPFSVALAECSKGSKLEKPSLVVTTERKKTRSTSHKVRRDRIGFGYWEFYGSCKSTGCVVDAMSKLYVPTTGREAYRFGAVDSRTRSSPPPTTSSSSSNNSCSLIFTDRPQMKKETGCKKSVLPFGLSLTFRRGHR